MKGIYFLGKGQFEERDLKMRPLKANEVLIQNMACGVCGTDIHIARGEKGSAEVEPPVVLGHEYSGLVLQVGSDVKSIQVGDHVTVDPNIYCGHCRYCHNGQKQFCENLQAVGVNRDGGFAQYSLVPETQVFVMSAEISYTSMAMAEPLACCLHGIAQIDIHPGDTACVIGGGAIGLIMAQLLRLKGASKILLSEPMAQRRALALRIGAVDHVFEPGDALLEEIQQLTHRLGVDVVIECAGTPAAVKQAIEITDRGGRVLLFSVPSPETRVDLPLFDVFRKELKISGSFVNPDTHQQAVDLLNQKKIDVESLITHRFPLDRLTEALRAQTSPEAIKVIVLPQSDSDS